MTLHGKGKEMAECSLPASPSKVAREMFSVPPDQPYHLLDIIQRSQSAQSGAEGEHYPKFYPQNHVRLKQYVIFK